ncbi:MAG: Rne/Rng family ribonuclease [Rhodocyclales bacterium]|nr:Rne/Rng family ribonuclease [Rhodocyclales bacterium]
MNEEFLINFTPQETRVALLQQGIVQELHIERTNGRGIVGNVYLGRVVRVLPGMQSAVIDIGLERTAFLHVGDIWSEKAANGNGHDGPRPIERILGEGQQLMVQVLKDPIGTKGARLSTQVSIAGRLLVYLPQEKHIGISQRIDEAGGYIARTVAESASETELATDIAYLRRLWAEIRERSEGALAPVMLHHDLTLAQRVLRDLVTRDTSRVLIDSRENFQKLSNFAQEYMPQLAPLLVHYKGERPLFDLNGVEDEIQRALARRVDLKSGGYLIMDQTEAMTTIDVNTGGFVGVRNFDDTIFKTNLEAAQTIARQLRLRNLGGIIIVDFIDMESAEHRNAVLGEFNKALARDHTRITVNGFTQLGLVEMTRKRTRESLAHVLCEPCPTCGGRGEIKTARTVAYEILRELLREARQFNAREYTARTVAYEILRELLREARQFNAREFRLLAAPAVIDLFLDEESQAMAMLSDFIGKPVSLHAEPSYTQEQFDIVLL